MAGCMPWGELEAGFLGSGVVMFRRGIRVATHHLQLVNDISVYVSVLMSSVVQCNGSKKIK